MKQNKHILVDKYIYQLSNKKYRLFIRSGKYYYSCTCKTLQEAKQIRKIKMAEKVLINNKKTRRLATVNEFVNIWFSIYCMKELKTTTTYSMKQTISKYVLPDLGDKKINEVTTLQLQEFFSNLRNKDNFNLTGKISDKTVYRVYKVMRNMFNRAVDWEFIEKNPLNKVKIKKVKYTETSIYSKKEIFEILELLNNENIVDKTIFSLFITTGMRKCELLGLHLEDINLLDGIITVSRNLNWNKFEHKYYEVSPKTQSSYRSIPIPRNMVEILEAYLKSRKNIIKDNKILFINKKGKRIGFDYLNYRWNKFINKYNLKYITLHGLRHSYCSLQINENKNLNISLVSKLMGHSQLSTTLKYLHSNFMEEKAIISIFKI